MDLRASATDPLTGKSVPVSIVSRNGDQAVIQADLTDSPRLITIDEVPTGAPNPAPAPTPAPTPAPSPSPSPTCRKHGNGDVNCDGKIDFKDMSALLAKQHGKDKTSDINGDGVVDFKDISLLLSHYNQ